MRSMRQMQKSYASHKHGSRGRSGTATVESSRFSPTRRTTTVPTGLLADQAAKVREGGRCRGDGSSGLRLSAKSVAQPIPHTCRGGGHRRRHRGQVRRLPHRACPPPRRQKGVGSRAHCRTVCREWRPCRKGQSVRTSPHTPGIGTRRWAFGFSSQEYSESARGWQLAAGLD
jgi:hypothetical protein